MATLAYIGFVFAASTLGAFLGFVAHFARAHLTYVPEDLGLGEPWDSLTRDDYLFEKHVVGAEWDNNGFWAAESNRNLAYYIISGIVMPIILGFVFWPERQAAVTLACKAFASIGVTPIVCG